MLLPFGTLAGMDTGARPFAAGVVVLFLVMAAIDALFAPRRLRGISIELPEVTRASKDRELKLLVRIRNERQMATTLRIALETPAALQSRAEETSVVLPANNEWSQFDWSLVPNERGRFTIRSARAETPSPFGLWGFWKSFDALSEVRVYPNLFRERRNLAALFLNRGALGLHAQRMVGKGRDFEKLRDYIPGDSYDEVHWKATAKRGQPVTKIFQIERTQEIYVIIDASRLSARPASRTPNAESRTPEKPSTFDTRPSTSLERFITAALVLGLAAEHQGDLFGLLTFSDKIETFIRARNGKAHYHACRDALYTLQPREVTPDFEELSTFIRLRMRRRALFFFLTSLDDPVLAESFVRNMDLLCRQHLILVNMLQPPGTQPLFSNAVETEGELYEKLGGHMRWQNLRELEKVLHRRGVRMSLLESERLAVDLVSQYVNVKQRQLL
ncbi:MAG TPA: DUF58 domain-containing protein, partial [Candidatus Acidoferrum sp.]|nr:DUF58 domain-containing protein [Candidatus Acidoferrum sp.]